MKNFLFCKKFFGPQKGSATAVSMIFSTGILAASLGVVSLMTNTSNENKNVENSNISYFAAERGLEYALYDVSGHLPGYEIADNSDQGLLKSKITSAKTDIAIENRSASETNTITVPSQGSGNASDSDWNTVSKDKSSTIPLYIDNTGN